MKLKSLILLSLAAMVLLALFHVAFRPDRLTTAILGSRVMTEQEISLLENSKNNYRPGEYFPWLDVAASIRDRNDTVWVTNKRCWRCFHRLCVVKYRSSPLTWQNLCGRSGDLYICPHCPRQVAFDCKLLN